MDLILAFACTFLKEMYHKFPGADLARNCPAQSMSPADRSRSHKCPWMPLRVNNHLEQFVTIWNNLRWRASSVCCRRGFCIIRRQVKKTLAQCVKNCSRNCHKFSEILPRLCRNFTGFPNILINFDHQSDP